MTGASRSGNNRLNRRNVLQAIDYSLLRLQTDYVDLYQFHWPERSVPSFGRRGLGEIDDQGGTVAIEEALTALQT